MILAISLIAVIWLLGFSLAMYNLEQTIKNKPERMEAYRKYKREKNIRLAKSLGVKYEPK